MLYCETDYESEPGDILFEIWDVDNFWFKKLDTKRRKRCECCKELIAIGEDSLAFPFYKVPESDIEIQIHGEDGQVPRAPRYLCEKCGEIWLSLYALGYCPWPAGTREALKEYQELTGFKPGKITFGRP